MESVYLETTIISYLVARPSRDLVLAAHQSVTRDWWDTQRPKYRCVISQEVVREVANGEREMAQRRLAMIDDLPRIALGGEVARLVESFMQTGALPPHMRTDAVHLAAAVFARVDYLLTWNCRHLANAQILRRLAKEAARQRLTLPGVCTPMELAGGAYDVHE